MPSASPQPLVSIILPAYNRADTIVSAIESVLRQTWQDFELLVVDDCSTDTTVAQAKSVEDPRITVLSTPQNKGPAGARNTGLRAAQGTWVAFQDSDDEWLPEKLELQMARLLDPKANWIAAYCGMVVIGKIAPPRERRTRATYIPGPDAQIIQGDIFMGLMRDSLVSTQMLVAKRSELEAVGGFDETLMALEDWELALRLNERGPFAFVDEPLVLQRFSVNSVTRDQPRRTKARAQIIEKHAQLMQRAPKLYAHQLRSLAGEYRTMGDLDSAVKAILDACKVYPKSLGSWIRAIYLLGFRFKRGLQK